MKLLLEPLPVVPAVAIFGVGHVGLELARILARHDLELHLVDSRPDQLTAERLPCSTTPWHGCTCTTCRCCPSWCSPSCPPGTHVLVMTHDHAEDAALCDAALRLRPARLDRADRVVGEVGAVPASCSPRGTTPEAIARITTPIGLPGSTGKEPATIAVSVAAGLLQLFEREARRARPCSAGDDLPRHVPRHPGQPVHRRRPARRRPTRACSSGRRDRCPRAPSRRAAEHPAEEVVDLTGGLVLPGFVDTHVHFPQVRAIGGLGPAAAGLARPVRAARGGAAG